MTASNPEEPATSKSLDATERPTPARRLRRVLVKLALSLLCAALLFVIAEGVASITLLVRDLDESGVTLAEHRHTTYDPLLGWVNEPDQSIPNMYGPGLGLHTNSLGFRSTHEFSKEVPAGKMRIVCSGDSFTLGYGVSDQTTWASQLEVLEPKLETVNMGQGGYGADQAYLWYKRDGSELEHDVQLFAFITGDFIRAGRSTNFGLPKPVLTLNDGELQTTGIPVSRLPYLVPYFVHNRRRFSELNILQLVNGPEVPNAQRGVAMTEIQLRETMVAMFRELKRLNEERGSRLVAVHLPGERDLTNVKSKGWAEFLTVELENIGVPYLNLIEDLGEVPEPAIPSLFIQPGEIDLSGAAGHFTVKGNRWAATQILRRLSELPNFTEELAHR